MFQLDSTIPLEDSVLVQDDVKQSPRIHAFQSSEEGEQQKKTKMSEECNQTPLNNIQNTSTLHLFDSTSIQVEQTTQIAGVDALPDQSEQHEIAMKNNSSSNNNKGTWRIDTPK